MITYTVEDPEFSESILITEPEDREHADVINAAPKKLIENDLALKEELNDFEENGKLPSPHKLRLNQNNSKAYDGSTDVDWNLKGYGYVTVEGVSERVAVPSGGGAQQYEWIDYTGIRVDGADNLTTEDDGYLLDAKQGKILKEKNDQAIRTTSLCGGKNLLKITTPGIATMGVTLTINKDSDGNVIDITANGKATSNVDVVIGQTDPARTNAVKLSGCPTNASGSTNYSLTIIKDNDPLAPAVSAEDTGGGATFSNGDETANVRLYIKNGYTANNLKFYPMVRVATDLDDTYQPYAKSNLALTNITDDHEEWISDLEDSADDLEDRVSDIEDRMDGLAFSVTSGGILRITYDDGE